MRNRISEFIKSVLAGMAIAIGGMVYLSCDKYVGALLFTAGLITVVSFGLNLYTGKIGYVLNGDKEFFVDTLLSIPGNLIGCLLIGLIKSPVGNVVQICENKLDKTFTSVLADAVLCGILIFICVDIFKKRNTYLGILICIPAFILAGFEHSVADMFYFFNARIFSAESVIFIITVIIGNAVGGLIIPLLLIISEKIKRKE